MEIKDQIAIVTGGASGLGADTVRALAAKGAKVAVLDLNEDLAKTMADEVGGLAVKVDVANADSVAAAMTTVREKLGVARIVINAAGIGIGRKITNRKGPHPLDEFLRVVNVNLTGTFDVCRLASTDMTTLEPVTEDGERGVFVNVASIFGYDGPVGNTAYAASKAGVIGMTLPMARDLAPYGIRVMTIAPGVFDTPLARAETGEEGFNRLLSIIPFPKRAGKPSEFAQMACHIVENSMLNGEVIRLDAGMRMGLIL
ncbi:MAG: 3-hydroxyacyl-CoA dehydrogenase [Gammaproteobacteria bacterium]|nr:MAG: 3-hydroxyacyl-CoA dehydrogenase [Gammaproteobacteria bacterium]RLA49754.1 MAG: 3-hydroxyacyl-CoA dehydrogenase [Gammaproteobacteria bacterium]